MNDRLARPYREPASRDPDEPPPPAELFFESEDPEARRGSSVAMFQIFSVPPLVAVVLAGVFSPEAGLGGLVVSAVGAFVWWKRPKRDGFTFRVDDVLTVTASGGKEPLVRLPLADLLDVKLDTKTIQRVQEGSSPIPAVRFSEATVGPEVDTCRVVLVTRRDEFVALGDTFVAHMHATEWLGKIRVFLRKHGWLPIDERDKRDSRDPRDSG